MSNAVHQPYCPQAAERTITADLEALISKAVNPAKADYAVLTGAPPLQPTVPSLSTEFFLSTAANQSFHPIGLLQGSRSTPGARSSATTDPTWSMSSPAQPTLL